MIICSEKFAFSHAEQTIHNHLANWTLSAFQNSDEGLGYSFFTLLRQVAISYYYLSCSKYLLHEIFPLISTNLYNISGLSLGGLLEGSSPENLVEHINRANVNYETVAGILMASLKKRRLVGRLMRWIGCINFILVALTYTIGYAAIKNDEEEKNLKKLPTNDTYFPTSSARFLDLFNKLLVHNKESWVVFSS